ncbi:EAL domain-containing protein [Limimaricola pyoseonensis]|uniref:EAL domain, c-di-GMP-specific phosphodiesterase class I (Or its enzymatically inactive variant) n=1 Tax=Limimaricola pyoseonensis TaxID=521013 RepID=A0A1G7K0D0_9RHOB|nr:EAL domain-containing protein [Limimaricola pyoseonensis]SDF30738.1 EAL domain, c-di-GMP-specific phosphodiesterase class I (or its enzymatically inactive variant) [Limimaricola pyoseonensis]
MTFAEAEAPPDPLSHVMALRDAEIPELVRTALEQGRARLAFQPVVAAGPGHRIAFHEGLIRLLDDRDRTLPARHFLPGIEPTPLGRDIDRAALHLGFAALRAEPRLRLSVNMSARSIGDAEWRATLAHGLARSPGIGGRLIFEVSENSAMLLPELLVRFMQEMQPLGVCFALDDFGGGLISFRHLRGFLFDLVKIDGGYARGIDGSADNQVLCEALITVARQFGMYAVAEGVERPEEAALLTRLGADCLQGYLYGRPVPAPEWRCPDRRGC